MSHEVGSKRRIGDHVAGAIEWMLGGYLAALCRLFDVRPENLRKPEDRPNAPPPTGGISSLD